LFSMPFLLLAGAYFVARLINIFLFGHLWHTKEEINCREKYAEFLIRTAFAFKRFNENAQWPQYKKWEKNWNIKSPKQNDISGSTTWISNVFFIL
jgi:hypothetical protein